MRVVTALLAALAATVAVDAVDKDPVFLRWLDGSRPLDAAIGHYWERALSDELTAVEWVDLGTMLFERGFPKDAIEAFRTAADLEPEMTEAWFRTGLVYHKRGEPNRARRAYDRCLDIRPGHGWCNFYLGLLEEREGNPERAVERFETAFRHAPALADPEVNTELLYSKLALAAKIGHYRGERFEVMAPMGYLEPGRIRGLQAELVPSAASPVPPPSAEPPSSAAPAPGLPSGSARTVPGPAPETAAGSERSTPRESPWPVRGRSTGRVAPRDGAPPPDPTPNSRSTEQGSPFHIRDVSPEARLAPLFGPTGPTAT